VRPALRERRRDQTRHAHAEIAEALVGALVLDRRRGDVVEEAAVLVVRQDEHRPAPLRALAEPVHHRGEERLAEADVVRRVVVVGEKAWIDDRDRRQRARLRVLEELGERHDLVGLRAQRGEQREEREVDVVVLPGDAGRDRACRRSSAT
jgi:hypothetical protein